MRKEYFFFLILLLAAAVVTGATIGMIGNLNYIIHQTDILESVQSSQTEDVMDDDTGTAITPENKVNKLNSSSDTTIKSSSGNVSSELLIVTHEEQAEVADMLTKLGIDANKSYNERIAEFQKKYSIEPTGNLDSMTLNTIVKELRLQQTSRRATV